MSRPDQAKYDLFAHPFERLDDHIILFSQRHGFQVVRNLNRQPCRVLQKPGNPHYLLDISYDDYWVETEYRHDLLYSVTLIAYYTPSTNDQYVWRMSAVLASHITFLQMEQDLQRYVENADVLTQSWTPESILEHGQCSENLARRYYGSSK